MRSLLISPALQFAPYSSLKGTVKINKWSKCSQKQHPYKYECYVVAAFIQPFVSTRNGSSSFTAVRFFILPILAFFPFHFRLMVFYINFMLSCWSLQAHECAPKEGTGCWGCTGQSQECVHFCCTCNSISNGVCMYTLVSVCTSIY